MPYPIDPLSPGSDAMPVISDGEAYQAQLCQELGSVAESIDRTMQSLNGYVSSEINQVNNSVAQTTTQLFDAVDNPLQKVKANATNMAADLIDMAGAELQDIAPSVDKTQMVAASAGMQRVSAGPVCPGALPDGSVLYQTIPVTDINPISLSTLVQQGYRYQTSLDGRSYCIYRAATQPAYPPGTTQLPPGPLPVQQPPTITTPPAVIPPQIPPQPAVAGVPIVVEMPVGAVCPVHVPADPSLAGTFNPLTVMGFTFQPAVAAGMGQFIGPWAQSGVGGGAWFIVKGCDTGLVTPLVAGAAAPDNTQHWSTLAVIQVDGSVDFLCDTCAGEAQPPTQPPPSTQPPVQPPQPPPLGDWIDRLCKCLTQGTITAQKVWVNCDTCEVRVLSDKSEPLVKPWVVAVEIDGKGQATYVATCKEQEKQPEEKPGEVAPLKPPKQVGELLRAVCDLPFRPEWPKEMAYTSVSTSRVVSVAFSILSFIPAKVLSVIKPDGATIALAAIVWLSGESLKLTQKTAALLGCEDDIGAALFSRQLMGFFERLMPGGFTEAIARTSQSINVKCPSLLPSLDQAHASYLSGTITEEVWRCWVRANGYIDAAERSVMVAARNRPNADQLNHLRRRELISFQDWTKKMREIGFIDPAEATDTYDLTEQLPGMADIIRFMVRDVADPAIVDKFQLDTDFNAKFQGRLEQYAKWQGIDADIAKFAWRAHWQIPSPTQLFEMFHRLGRDAQGNPIPQVLSDIETALEQQDIAPFWIQRYLDISYRLPTRVDVRRGYRIGIFTEQDVFQFYVKSGYDKKASQALTAFSTNEKLISWSNHTFVKQFSRGELTEAELRNNLALVKATPDAIDFAVNYGRELMRVNRRNKCLKAIRRRVFLGELSYQQTVQEILTHVSDNDSADELATTWFCERASASRELPLRQVLTLFREQVIAADDLYQRLLRLRYSDADATAIVNRAVSELQRALDKAEQQRLAKLQRIQQQAERLLLKSTQQQEKDRQRTEAARLKAEQAAESRETKIMEAAKVLSNTMQVPATEVYGRMLSAYRRLVRAGGYSATQAADAAVKAAGDKAATDFNTWETIWLDFVTEAASDQV